MLQERASQRGRGRAPLGSPDRMPSRATAGCGQAILPSRPDIDVDPSIFEQAIRTGCR
jgi:hypothetical protein